MKGMTQRCGERKRWRNSPRLRVPASPRLSPLRAYTIIEAMVAAAILLTGIAAAAGLALTMVSQEEANVRVARAFNVQEQAGRLYQLGLEPAEILAIIPPEENVEALTFDAASTNVAGVGTVEIATCRLVFHAGVPMTDAAVQDEVLRTNDAILVRPSIR